MFISRLLIHFVLMKWFCWSKILELSKWSMHRRDLWKNRMSLCLVIFELLCSVWYMKESLECYFFWRFEVKTYATYHYTYICLLTNSISFHLHLFHKYFIELQYILMVRLILFILFCKYFWKFWFIETRITKIRSCTYHSWMVGRVAHHSADFESYICEKMCKSKTIMSISNAAHC